jgi:dinuclear metal center YbgI/SA1388 family protein
MADARAIADYLDRLLRTSEIPDYPNALNGLQLDGGREVRRVATAVDFSSHTVDRCAERGAELLLVHHGMFWGGLQRLTGVAYRQLATLIEHGIAVYASHLPLDLHPDVGNNVLLARELGLVPTTGFARYKTIDIGVSGSADVETRDLVARATTFAQNHETTVVATSFSPTRRTKRWAICTGAGAGSETIDEALAAGIDTMIVGEGPHHTAVRARDTGLVIIYAGHYATETLGVRALGARLERAMGIETSFIDAPTGL